MSADDVDGETAHPVPGPPRSGDPGSRTTTFPMTAARDLESRRSMPHVDHVRTVSAPAAAGVAREGATLSVSVVVYRPNLAELGETLSSLRAAVEHARAAGVASAVAVDIIDNGSLDEDALDALVRDIVGAGDVFDGSILRGHGNVGYGLGHNLSLTVSRARFHLVLNPDVVMEPDAIARAIEALEANPDVGLLAPQVFDGEMERQYLCRDYPTILVLFLRGFAPGWLRRRCRRYMERHELRDVTGDTFRRGIPLISGAFMFGRTDVLQRVGGFSSAYFMYFEDSELSLAVGRVAAVAYAPSVRIVHLGGGAARKGLHHVRLFLRSALTFFRRNGWRLY